MVDTLLLGSDDLKIIKKWKYDTTIIDRDGLKKKKKIKFVF